jgi:ATP-dependent Lon protease
MKTEVPDQVAAFIRDIDDGGKLADFVAGGLEVETAEKQAVLDELDPLKRVKLSQRLVGKQLKIASISDKIQQDVQSQFSDAQRKAWLHEQMRAIQKELGEDEESGKSPAQEWRDKVEAAALPPAALEQAQRELKRIEYVPEGSPEFGVISTYLETLTSLPWNAESEDHHDLKRARRILDRDHFGLEKVKRRLLEHLAVRKLNPKGHSPILCLFGPPGVGKTSLGQSIADALGRTFVRVSLGGVRDESDIRGHRRTYIGAMPGRLVNEIRRAGTRNPVVLLDEIDKLGRDFRGDPSSALLEVLDPKQNHTFTDHYLDVPFDLSKVLFIATANDLGPIPGPLRDRLEIVELGSYTEREKLAIATRYLVPRQRREHGLKKAQCTILPEALRHLVAHYTREAGVRELERQIAALCRAVAARIASEESTGEIVGKTFVEKELGPPKFLHDEKLDAPRLGIVTGLAWTSVGGELLHIEALRFPGKGHVQLTGQLGDVMKESVQAAWSLLRSRGDALGLSKEAFAEHDVHVHVPAGATPKDGPSAGVAMFTALASQFTGHPVRADIAMTGEISLRGTVLPIGGLKEKLLAAVRAGIKTVLIPHENEKDLVDVPSEARRMLKIIPVHTVDEVLRHALV